MIGEHGISIWFFIGIALVVNGALIFAAGVWQLLNPPAHPVVLFQLHANLWWGAALLAFGIIYTVRFRPRRTAAGPLTGARHAAEQ